MEMTMNWAKSYSHCGRSPLCPLSPGSLRQGWPGANTTEQNGFLVCCFPFPI